MKSADEIIEYFGIESPNEIDLEAICHYFNAEVQVKALSGCEGRLIGYKGKAIITANSNSSKNRQRFSIAHELGHWILDQGKVAHSCTETSLNNFSADLSIEARANRFAARLLMPEQILRPICKGIKFKLRDISILADTFNVSNTAMAFRILELNLQNGILIWSDGIKVKSFIPNPGLPKKIWPITLIDKESNAYHLKDKEVGERRGFSMPGDLWINRADASYYELFEDSMVVAPGIILSLISWDNEKYLLKQADD